MSIKSCVLLFMLCLLVSCTQGFNGVCGFKPLGENEQGIEFVRVMCEAQ